MDRLDDFGFIWDLLGFGFVDISLDRLECFESFGIVLIRSLVIIYDRLASSKSLGVVSDLLYRRRLDPLIWKPCHLAHL